MPYSSRSELPAAVRKLPLPKQDQWMAAFNAAFARYKDEARAFRIAWSAIQAKGQGGGQSAAELAELLPAFANGAARLLLFPRGKFRHPEYGGMNFDDAFFQEIKDNFDKKVLGTTLPFIDIDHNHGAAAGWIHSISIEPDGLWADHVEWTELGRQMVESGQYRYFSPWWGQYKDPGSGVTYDRVLRGGGLTNVPFLKILPPVELLEQVGGSYLLTEWAKVDAPDVARLAAAIRAESTSTTTMTEDPRQALVQLAEKLAREQNVPYLAGLERAKAERQDLVREIGECYGPLRLTEPAQALALTFVPLSKHRRLDKLVTQRAIKKGIPYVEALREIVAEDPAAYEAALMEYA